MTNSKSQRSVDAFAGSWNASDGAGCAAPFAEDADFIAVNGIHAKGRDLIGRGHAEILSTIFKGARMRRGTTENG